MGDFFKWGLVALAVFVAWRWLTSGVNLNASLGSNYGYGYGVPTAPPQAGYSFMMPGLTFGVNPSNWNF